MLETEEGKEKLRKVEKLAKVSDDLGVPMPQLALIWCLKNPNVSTVITGASNVKQVEQNMKAMELVDKVDEAAMERIEEILDNKPGSDMDWRRA